MNKMESMTDMESIQKFRIFCYLPGHYISEEVECDSITIKDGAYTFWVYGKKGELEVCYSYPVNFTIVERIDEE